MGIPLPTSANPATGVPTAGDQANAVVSGAFTVAGQVSQPFCFYGAFNVLIYPTLVNALTTVAGSATATFGSATGLAVGETVVSTLVPPGTVVGAIQSTVTVTLSGLTNAQIAALTSGTDAAATLVGAGVTVSATINLERSFDGGSTWITCGVGGGGQPASYVLGSSAITNPISFTVGEPERGVAYRLHCIAYASGNIAYRISATGLAAMTWGIPVG